MYQTKYKCIQFNWIIEELQRDRKAVIYWSHNSYKRVEWSFIYLNLLRLNSDQSLLSPHSVTISANTQVMRIKEMAIKTWSALMFLTKFSELQEIWEDHLKNDDVTLSSTKKDSHMNGHY